MMHWIEAMFRKDPNWFLKKVSGVIHVGANVGQERDLYRHYGLPVVWIEPIPEIFERLQANIEDYPNQVAFKFLVTDKDDTEYAFHVSNNEGASSSILDLKLHKDIWPGVVYVKTITLRSSTLPSLLQREHIDATRYNALIMDTQGSESLVLQGAVSILGRFRFIKTEVPDFESYAGCCRLDDIRAFLKQYGFQQVSLHKFAEHCNGGSYFDVVFENKAVQWLSAKDFFIKATSESTKDVKTVLTILGRRLEAIKLGPFLEEVKPDWVMGQVKPPP